MKKKFFTLIEVTIALFLATILLTCIFRFFSQITTCEKNMKIASEKIFLKHFLNVKLETVFSHLTLKTFQKEPLFFTKDTSLYFFYDNGVDPDPSFSSYLFARLYVKDKNLILESRPINSLTLKALENSPKISREEILLKNVKSLRFEFLEKTLPKSSGQKYFYQRSFFWEKEDPPPVVKIKITTEDDELLNYTYFLPSEKPSIFYYHKRSS
jgi:hypothetical protein